MCLLGKLLISRTSRLQTDKRRSNLDSGGPKTLRSVKIGLKLGLCKKKLTFPVDRALIGWWNELTIDMSAWDNWQFWPNLNRSWFNGHDCATWQWLVKQVGGSESLYSGRPDPPINPPNLNRSLGKSDESNDAMCDVDFWSLTSHWILI